MQKQKIHDNGIQWFTFDLLSRFPGVKHAIFSRHGGCSEHPYNSLNVHEGVGDALSHVKQNRELIRRTLGLDILAWGNQCHGNSILEVDSYWKEPAICDALTTKCLNTGLMVMHADCQAAIIYDPIKHAVANVHSGWRGSVQNIYSRAIAFMIDRYGSRAEDLIVCISPSLGPDSSEFINYKTELPEAFWQYQFKQNYFDFWKISRAQLMESGILGKNIEIAGICTRSNAEDFFSYRRDKQTGRNATVVALMDLK